MTKRLSICFVGGILFFIFLYVYANTLDTNTATNSRIKMNNYLIIDNGFKTNDDPVIDNSRLIINKMPAINDETIMNNITVKNNRLVTNNETVMSKKPVMNKTTREISTNGDCYNDPSTTDGVQNLYSNSLTKQNEMPIPDRGIFFHETSCFGNEGITITSRQACAVESAAMMNPNMTIYLLVLSPAKLSNATRNIAEQLTSYDNVKIRRISIDDYVKSTPLKDWDIAKAIRSSNWPNIHTSDILRYLTLWKFGGIYLDLDVVIITSLDGLTNFSGVEDSESIAAGVMGFGITTGPGRKIIDECLREVRDNFRGDLWSHNALGVIKRTLQKICNTSRVEDMTKDRCQGFNLYPTSYFYPIHWREWRQYFERDETNQTMKKIANARAIHVWNKLSNKEIVRVGSQVPYDIVAKKYCPKVYEISGETF